MDPDTLLDFLRSRATVRSFENRPIPRQTLARVLEAATRAPSPTNRQPWRFTVVTAPSLMRRIIQATQESIDEVRGAIAKGPKPDHLSGYWDFFVKPLQSATAFVAGQYRLLPDSIGTMIADAGGDARAYDTCERWNAELCSTSAAMMQLLLQAHAEGLGACWMSGFLLARERISELLRIRPPWKMLGGVALGWPAEKPAPQPRKPLEKVVEWLDEDRVSSADDAGGTAP